MPRAFSRRSTTAARSTSAHRPTWRSWSCARVNFEFLDNYKGTRKGKQRLFPMATVVGGKKAPARA